MQEQKPKIDKSKLTTDQLAQLEQYESTQKQLTQLEDIANMAHEAINMLDEQKKTGTKTASDFGALLVDMRESLSALSNKQAPPMPDFAKPVVDALKPLETALAALQKVKPVVVPAPSVTVEPTPIDLSGIEKALSGLPKAFEKAIALIPTVDIPETDFQPLLDAWEGISEQLVSIETGVRLKPQPGTMKVTNSDGTKIIAGANTANTTSIANSVTSVVLLRPDPNRKSGSIFNDDASAYLYVCFDSPASTTNFKIKISPMGYFEFTLPIYTGLVTGLASAASGSARVSEEF